MSLKKILVSLSNEVKCYDCFAIENFLLKIMKLKIIDILHDTEIDHDSRRSSQENGHKDVDKYDLAFNHSWSTMGLAFCPLSEHGGE